MGLLDHLWDDTLAGPRPDSGLGKLRKHATFGGRTISAKDPEIGSNSRYEAVEEAARVTRSIMIVKPPLAGQKDSPPSSPAGGTPPISPLTSGTSPASPFSGSGKEAFRFRRKSVSFTFEKASGVGPRSPRPPYDL